MKMQKLNVTVDNLSKIYETMLLTGMNKPYTNPDNGDITTKVTIQARPKNASLEDGAIKEMEVTVKGSLDVKNYQLYQEVDFKNVMMNIGSSGNYAFKNVSTWLNVAMKADYLVALDAKGKPIENPKPQGNN